MSIYRHLSRAQRAPLKLVVRKMNKLERSRDHQIATFEFNQSVTQTLHEFGWRKCEYLNALRRREKRATYLQKFICVRSIYPFG